MKKIWTSFYQIVLWGATSNSNETTIIARRYPTADREEGVYVIANNPSLSRRTNCSYHWQGSGIQLRIRVKPVNWETLEEGKLTDDQQQHRKMWYNEPQISSWKILPQRSGAARGALAPPLNDRRPDTTGRIMRVGFVEGILLYMQHTLVVMPRHHIDIFHAVGVCP